jgi:tRNA dimethylallyltransferase
MNKVILLVGPTCVGKTETSILLAKTLKTEIISADSMQIYKHMDIGTEKPSPKQRKEVKHHMIDIIEPSESYSAGRYVEDVTPIINRLHKQNKIPIITGGTGLYIKAMTRGLFKGPSADWELRTELLKEDTASLYMRLKGIDPETASQIMPNDTRRIIRALEVCIKSGKKMSEIKKDLTTPLPYEFIKIGLTRDRKELYQMIEKRVDDMLKRGLVEEVKKILLMNPDRTPMQAIGYKEIAAYLEGQYSLDEAIWLIKRNTKRYAKRQFTWFKKEEGIHWIDITGITDAGVVLEKILPVLREYEIDV